MKQDDKFEKELEEIRELVDRAAKAMENLTKNQNERAKEELTRLNKEKAELSKKWFESFGDEDSKK